MKTAILTDPDCDISHELIQRFHMKVMHPRTIYPERDYVDGVDILPETIHQRFPEEILAISTPSSQDVKDMAEEIKAEGCTHVLAFRISSGLSGTCNTVGSILRDEKELISFVPDARSISFGADILAVWVAMQLEKGRSFDELKEMPPKKVGGSKVFYYTDTLAYPRKGGQIDLVTSMVGSILNIKPIISCNEDGIHYTAAKIRGVRQGLSRLLPEAKSFAGGRPCLTALLNGRGQDASDEPRPRLIAGTPEGRPIMKKAITASLTVHTGPGLVEIGVLRLWQAQIHSHLPHMKHPAAFFLPCLLNHGTSCKMSVSLSSLTCLRSGPKPEFSSCLL